MYDLALSSCLLSKNMNMDVINKNNSLFRITRQNKIHLIPQSTNQFYMEQVDTSMRFFKK